MPWNCALERVSHSDQLPDSLSLRSALKPGLPLVAVVLVSFPGFQTTFSYLVHCFHILTKIPVSLPTAGSEQMQWNEIYNFILIPNHWQITISSKLRIHKSTQYSPRYVGLKNECSKVQISDCFFGEQVKTLSLLEMKAEEIKRHL